MNEKGIEAGNLSDYINNNEEEVLKLAEEFKKPKFKIGGKIKSAAEMFKCGGKTKKVEKKQEGGETPNHTIYDLKTGKVSKKVDGIGNKETYVDGPSRRTLEVFNGDSTIVAKDPNWPESRSRSYEDIVTFMRNKDIGFDTNLRSFNGMKEMFHRKYPNVKSMANGGETDGIKKTSINYGPDFKEFEDNTGRYTRIIPNKQDTIWVFNDWGTNREVRTSPYGYIGRFDDIYGNNRQLSPEESTVVRKEVESRMQNIPHKKYLIDRYGDEMLMPENKTKHSGKSRKSALWYLRSNPSLIPDIPRSAQSGMKFDNNTIIDKNNKQSFLQKAILTGSIAENPAVMTASGWHHEKDGQVDQNKYITPGEAQLMKNLSIIGSTAGTVMNPIVPAEHIAFNATDYAYPLAETILGIPLISSFSRKIADKIIEKKSKKTNVSSALWDLRSNNFEIVPKFDKYQ